MNKKYLIFFLALTMCAAMSAKGDDTLLIQNPDSRTAFSLDGQWNIIPDPYENGYYNHRYEPHENGYFKNNKAKNPSDLVEYDFSRSQKLNVPGDWNSQDDKLFFYEGTVWYHKDFDLKKQAGHRYILYFGAVNYSAKVYVNGGKVGEHEGGFTSFQFDITDELEDGKNFVVVKVDNRREREQVPTVNTDWWNYGGITRSVRILELPRNTIEDYFVQLKKDSQTQLEGWVKTTGASTEDVQLRIPALNLSQTIRVDKNGFGRFSVAAKPQLWTPEAPKLYRVMLSHGDEVVEDKIGFRTVSVDGEDILLNGKSLFLKGISIHEESPLRTGRAWSEEDARILLGWAKELGCNFVRLAHYPHNENMVKVADEIGLLVWSEIPVYWTVLFDNKTVYENAENQLREMISRDKNRASVILWSMANETPDSKPRLRFISDLAKTARKLDNTRLITAALDTQSSDEYGRVIDDPLSGVVDVIGINSYCGWYGGTPESCAGLKWRSDYNKPVIMSEVGGGALQGYHGDANQRWTEEYQAAVYRHNLAMMDNIPFLRGITPWILKDFRSPRRPLPDIQDFWNRKGLISDSGIKKLAWQVLHDYYENK